MIKFWKERKQKQNNSHGHGEKSPALEKIRKKIVWQAGMAIMTVVLTGVLVFGMTAAWYTNVVATSNLTFQVAKYGVKVDAQIITTEAIIAAPGENGVIGIEVTNRSTEAVILSVAVEKDQMDEEIQKRIFFYVDSQLVQNGETMDRVYLNSLAGYDYTVFEKLTLTEEYHNDAQLKWCWVYDVLGYYVLGAPSEDGTTVTVEEYLRPIEYDYDEATFIENEDGTKTLETVDGTTTAEEFLVALSENDGYAGIISSHAMTGAYYQVDVDENGYGVYAYLCTPAEVDAATAYDVALGNAAADGEAASYLATLTIYASNIEAEIISANSPETLAAAVLMEDAEYIQLTGDIEIPAGTTLTLPEGADITLDLNGHTLTTAGSSGAAVTAGEGTSLTVVGGTLDGSDKGGNAFAVSGANVTLSGVTMKGYFMGLRVDDNAASGLDSTVRLVDCEISTSDTAVLVYGSGSLSGDSDTRIIIEGCTITSDDIAICGNGSANNPGKWGTDIQIINSTITSTDETAAIYHPQMEGTLNIYNSTITGNTGLVIKGGTVIITDSAISGTGTAATVEAPDLTVNGFNSTGDAIYVETGYGYEICLELNGTLTLSSNVGRELRIYEEDAPCFTLVDNRGLLETEE